MSFRRGDLVTRDLPGPALLVWRVASCRRGRLVLAVLFLSRRYVQSETTSIDGWRHATAEEVDAAERYAAKWNHTEDE